MQKAPFFGSIIADFPVGEAWWATAEDGVRIRVGLWRPDPNHHEGAPRGTVLLFPGRTEYIEKYAPTAADFAAYGFATLSVDWRGQGIADRLLDQPLTGHVGRFADFQLDVQATLKAARDLKLPEPYLLHGHSMGGCIGLRAMLNGLPVIAASFSGPMWGIELAPALRPFAWATSWLSRPLGLSGQMAPNTAPTPYVLDAPFDDNTLTLDREMWDLMGDQLRAEPGLSLGGPSLNWLYEALTEMRQLSRMPSPPQPCLTYLGANERIVSPQRIRDRMARWSNGELVIVPKGEHEVLMEGTDIRTPIAKAIITHYLKAMENNGCLANHDAQ
ncbi:alpha/beta hydrolase [Thalassobius sp. Cn5-15]|uniref:alpha/beta hydrolase n=1 Tax=Thalassobius sp. Cn5-15 TaxID=2917763 RepID=UPI001EF1CA2B|nr:alpha/beta hydrolase [Thalassobius sp. Cn5-15]MCG7491942.1 alpha/beta hydrolase [Thalassobius sp. Cn5-15]